MSKNWLDISIFGWVLLLLGSCISPLDIDQRLENNENILVVQGQVFQGVQPAEVRLSRVVSFASQIVDVVPGAQITIRDDQGFSETFREVEPGVYRTEGNRLVGAVGRSYELEIELITGRRYLSRPEVMPVGVPIKSVYTNVFQFEDFNEQGFPINYPAVRYRWDVDIPDLNRGPYLRWSWDAAWQFTEADLEPNNPFVNPKTCYIRAIDDPQRILLFNGDVNSIRNIQGLIGPSNRLNYEYEIRHVFNLYQHSISAQAYEYWQDVDAVVNQVGSVFDAPPAAVRGNVYNPEDEGEIVLGYFEATAIDTMRLSLNRTNFPGYNILTFCEPDFRFFPPRYSPPCLDCLQLSNSSLERPDYF
ncbi:MAG: DUF4249 domain-containing protein [Bacteroidota bacterium]